MLCYRRTHTEKIPNAGVLVGVNERRVALSLVKEEGDVET